MQTRTEYQNGYKASKEERRALAIASLRNDPPRKGEDVVFWFIELTAKGREVLYASPRYSHEEIASILDHPAGVR